MSSHPDSQRHDAEDAFDRWLDDLVADAPPETAHTDGNDLRATAAEFHAMAAAGQHERIAGANDAHTPSWEQIMDSTATPTMPTPLPRGPKLAAQSIGPEPSFWASLTNVAAVLLLIGSMTLAGYWATTTSFWPGGDGESPEPTQQLAIQPLATPDDEATPMSEGISDAGPVIGETAEVESGPAVVALAPDDEPLDLTANSVVGQIARSDPNVHSAATEDGTLVRTRLELREVPIDEDDPEGPTGHRVSGFVEAVDMDTESRLWSIGPLVFVSELHIHDGQVLFLHPFGDESALQSVDLETGDDLWQTPLGSGAMADATMNEWATRSIISEGTFIAYNQYAQVVTAVDLETQELAWSQEVEPPPATDRLPIIHYPADQLAASEGTVSLLIPGYEMIGLDAQTGDELWQVELPSSYDDQLVTAERFLPGEHDEMLIQQALQRVSSVVDSVVMQVDPATGDAVWSVQLEDAVGNAIATNDGTLYGAVLGDDGQMAIVTHDLASGEQISETATDYQLPDRVARDSTATVNGDQMALVVARTSMPANLMEPVTVSLETGESTSWNVTMAGLEPVSPLFHNEQPVILDPVAPAMLLDVPETDTATPTSDDEATPLASDPEFLADIPPVDPADFPQASDCTVEPLTVDEVMAILEEPLETWQNADPSAAFSRLGERDDDGTVPPEATPAMEGEDTVIAKDDHWSAPSQQMLEDVTEAHRQYVACTSHGMYFEMFAMMSTPALQSQILNWYRPTFVTKEQVRSDLELLEQGEVVDHFDTILRDAHPGLTVDPDPENSFVQYPDQVVVSIIEYTSEEGEPWRRIPAEPDSANTFIYQWDPESSGWRVIFG